MRNNLKLLLIMLFVIFVIEIIDASVWFAGKKKIIHEKQKHDVQVALLNYEQGKKKILDEFQQKKYLISGSNIYERIQNKQDQNIMDLLSNLAVEAFSDSWKLEIKVEEFTNFLLLAQFVDNEEIPSIEEILKNLIPILRYGDPYLKNVAIYNKKRKCQLFFDEHRLNELMKTGTLEEASILSARKAGDNFTRYNAIRINFKMVEGHMYIPVTVIGNVGYEENYMMLDTGASMSVISLDLAQKTGNEDLNLVPRKTFSTANGPLTCAITKREISIGDISIRNDVAVSIEENSNLLGMNFFDNKEYLIDTTTNSIYVWEQ